MTRLAACALVLALAACGGEEPAPAPTPTATVAAPRTLVAANLDLATLGARIAFPQGDTVDTVLSAGARPLGTLESFVACPQGTAACNPAELPAGTVYTYVHRITLAEPDLAAPAQPSAGPEVVEVAPTLFRTDRAAPGFAAGVGYDSAEAEAALGAADAITITLDAGHLIWRVTKGEGWKPGTTLTLWWQSTRAPAAPEPAYVLEVDGNQARALAPFPAAGEGGDADGGAGKGAKAAPAR